MQPFGLARPRTAMRVHLVRHGEVRHEGPERIYGDLEMPLSERGIAQLEAVARVLSNEPLAAVYASDLERARIGAESIARPHGLVPRVDPALREIYRGKWRLLTWDEVETRFPGGARRFVLEPETYRDHEGETIADVDERARAAFARIVEANDGKTVAVVSHSWVLRSLLARAFGASIARVMSLPVETGAIATLEGDSRGWQVTAMNRRAPRS